MKTSFFLFIFILCINLFAHENSENNGFTYRSHTENFDNSVTFFDPMVNFQGPQRNIGISESTSLSKVGNFLCNQFLEGSTYHSSALVTDSFVTIVFLNNSGEYDGNNFQNQRSFYTYIYSVTCRPME